MAKGISTPRPKHSMHRVPAALDVAFGGLWKLPCGQRGHGTKEDRSWNGCAVAASMEGNRASGRVSWGPSVREALEGTVPSRNLREGRKPWMEREEGRCLGDRPSAPIGLRQGGSRYRWEGNKTRRRFSG